MPDITIRTQAEFDALPAAFEKYTRIIIQNDPSLRAIVIREVPRNASIEVSGNASIEVYDNASVVAQGNASVVAQGNASVWAYGNASVRAYGNASVQAYDNASVWACGYASVWAHNNVSVLAHNQNAIRRCSATSKITLHDSSVCWDLTSNPAKISSFAEFSKHTNPVIAADSSSAATAAKLTSDQKNELLAQFKSFLESR
jgi:hypothetical protein